ncbi:MAG: GTP cyclohydrolase I FolE [Gammaproteobacteria bacterium]|nr:GTP cyclohydrolase I FolE [Gammaproteobacteria bacterium]
MTHQNRNIESISALYKSLLSEVGEDADREGLAKTPTRAARALDFLTQGYHQTLDEVVNGALFTSELSEIVIVKDIELYSLCEHHVLPFLGNCHVGYLPQGKVLGLSKVARIVDMFARRLQIQEKLTQEIAEAIETATGAMGVGVIIEAQHLCMSMRGVEKQHSIMKTSVLLGSFRDDHATRSEFLQLVK